MNRTIIAEIEYETTVDISKCWTDEHPSPVNNLRYLHTIASTENYIIVPETSFTEEPCVIFDRQETNGRVPSWEAELHYHSEVKGRFSIIDKRGPEFVATIEADRDFMITHNFGAFEVDNKTLVLDAITYDSADAYKKYTYVQEMLYGEIPEGNVNNITRFTIHLDPQKVDMDLLHEQEDGTFIEFGQINWKYAAKQKYRYGYAVQNEFKLHNAIMKLDFDDPMQTTKYELADGEFGTEPVFVENPDGDGSIEDDGFVVVQTLDTRARKASILILNATTMELEFKGLAPEMGLFGLHARFFKFDIGCSTDDCKPPNYHGSASTIFNTRILTFYISILVIISFNS